MNFTFLAKPLKALCNRLILGKIYIIALIGNPRHICLALMVKGGYMKKIIGLLVLAVLFNASVTFGACTIEQVREKARKVMTKFEQLEQTNHDEYMRLLLRFNNKSQLLDENDLDAWCEFYDQMLFEM